MREFDVIIVGGGPGGYVAAIRLMQFGIDVAVIEKERLGGVCLNHGCIPTKSLVKVADLFSEIGESENFGICLKDPVVDYYKVWERKNNIVEKLVSGIEFIFKKKSIPVINEEVIKFEKTDKGYKIYSKSSEYQTKFVILATGSSPKELPFIKFDGSRIYSSRDILKMQQLPQSLVVIGGGVIGCEFASIYSRLGVKVEIVEFLPKLVFNEDEEISRRLAMALKKSGIKLHLNTAVENYEDKNGKIILKLSNGKQIETEKVLVSVGRQPVMELDFINCDLIMENEFIKITDDFRTNLNNVFSIGDVTGKLMLAHTASKQGLIVADIIDNELNGKDHKIFKVEYKNIPKCTFTEPEIGSVGLTEKQAKERYENILIGKFPFSANGKALGLGNSFGFVKAIADAKTKKLIGLHIIGPLATELIAQGSILIGKEAEIEDMEKIVFAHPTLSEAIMEAIEDLENKAIHKV